MSPDGTAQPVSPPRGRALHGGRPPASAARRAGALAVRFNLVLIFLLVCFVGSRLSPEFLQQRNLFNLLQQSSIIGVVAVGMTFVILTAGIDLSVGSVLAFGGMASAMLISGGVAWQLAVLVAVAAGVAFGLVQGAISAYGRVPSFMTTLAGLVAIRGATYLLTDGAPKSVTGETFRLLGAGFFGTVPIVGVIFVAVAAVAALVLRYTTFGQYVYAVGGNEEAARLSGVPTRRIAIAVFAISGGLAAFGGVLLTSYLSVGQPTAGAGYELTAIAAVVLGGTSLFGGSGGVFGTFVAVLLLSSLTNIFNLMGVSSYYQQIVTGGVLVAAVVLNRYFDRRGGAA